MSNKSSGPPHSNTKSGSKSYFGIAPATLLFGRPMAVKLSQVMARMDVIDLHCRDTRQKAAMKGHIDPLARTFPSTISVGDSVLLKSTQLRSKLNTPFTPQPYQVVRGKDSMVSAKRETTSKEKADDTQTSPPLRTMDPDNMDPDNTPVESKSTTVSRDSTTVASDNTSPVHTTKSTTNFAAEGSPFIPSVDSEVGSSLRRSGRHKEPPPWLNDYIRA